ncbi:transaldolase [Corynebacterium sp. TAE3-ERU12]|uniref:transaldolase n=1 Tax=Corynebacterium sp. TAE3-ERU12 TaxID=2849491 RepID=UPI001C44C546|nr:transaldolase [Corynebacterium sp. TAE3-ERU12]MBV7295416.1 transaldolase [Corynebacterium sp. TAE3-ERU12]
MANTPLTQLAQTGTSTWLDDLSRGRLQSGNLTELMTERDVVGVTTNPAIFHTAMTVGDAYNTQLDQLADAGADAAEAVFTMAIEDVRNACDVLEPVYEETNGEDGRVSIEVDPRYAADYEQTIAQARELWSRVGKPNAMIKIPATDESLPAISDALAEGIAVNVTLIFSLQRYQQVVDAYIDGISRAKQAGLDISQIYSVASFFVSRVDSEVDGRLEAIGTDEALKLRGAAGVANARLAYDHFENTFTNSNERWAELAAAGANVQRPLWASTGVKNPDYPATMYVTGLAGPHTVNTMPEATLEATAAADIDQVPDTLSGTGAAAKQTMAQIAAVGVDIDDVFTLLEKQGVDKFVASWNELLDAIGGQLDERR